jgi:hypothetical protein
MSVSAFPQRARDRREHVLRVAASAAPLLEAAVAAGNATMIERIFEALGAFAQDDDAVVELLESVAVRDAQIVPIRSIK